MIRVSALHIYPVKGMRGLSLDSARVEFKGLRNDRRWVVTDQAGGFHSQRDTPALAAFRAFPLEDGLRLEHGSDVIEVGVPTGSAHEVTVWRDTVSANDAGDEVATWLSSRLGKPVRLCHMPESTRRRVNPDFNAGDDIVSFADGYPLLLGSESSLADLNARLPEAVTMARFRPNVVVAGAEPWAEDHWPELQIGEISFRNPKPCARCLVTTLNPETGESMGQEPLRTLSLFRLIDGKAMFATNLIPNAEGEIRVGDLVRA